MLIRFFLALFALVSASGCDTRGDDLAQELAQIEPRPALWRVSGSDDGDGSHSGKKPGHAYLFGSVHALPRGLNWQGEALERAFADSDALILEIPDTDDRDEIARSFAELASTPGQPPLLDRVAPDIRPAAMKLLEENRLDADQFAATESWAVALTLASATTTGLGTSADHGVEHALAQRFRKDDKPVFGLESAAAQFAIFDRLPAGAQRAMLEAVIADADEARDSYRDLVTAWLSGDVGKFSDATRTGILASPVLRESLLVARNRDWAGQLGTRIAAGETPFVAVGAAHLAGDDNVIALLTSRGYRVERLQ